jgi:hypothetical protein
MMEEICENNGELPLPDASDASPLLYNRRLAAYEWGGGEIIFTPVAGFDKKGFLTTNLAALDQGVISNTNTNDDLLCLLAFLHEYRHYQQDLQTGVGHWDYVARTEQIIRTLSLAKTTSADGDIRQPIDEGLSGYIQSQSACLVQRPEKEEILLIRAALAETEPNADQLAPILTTRRVIEADAVLYVYMLIMQSRADEATASALKGLTQLYQFFTMPDLYSDTLMMALRSFTTLVIEDIDNATKLQNLLRHTKALLAMCLAHPDPDTLISLGHDAKDYLPGVRFARLLQGSIKQMQALDEAPQSSHQFEAGLLAKTGFPYPSYFDCEVGWIRYLKAMKDKPFAAVTAARVEVLERKIRPEEGAEKATQRLFAETSAELVMSFVGYDLPLLMRRTDGLPQQILLTARGIAKPEYDVDRLRHILFWRLTEFISRRRPTFACPLFKSSYCEPKTERCQKPYADLNDVPADNLCRVRRTCFDTNRKSMTL